MNPRQQETISTWLTINSSPKTKSFFVKLRKYYVVVKNVALHAINCWNRIVIAVKTSLRWLLRPTLIIYLSDKAWNFRNSSCTHLMTGWELGFQSVYFVISWILIDIEVASRPLFRCLVENYFVCLQFRLWKLISKICIWHNGYSKLPLSLIDFLTQSRNRVPEIIAQLHSYSFVTLGLRYNNNK